jgi:hypothetical protein
LHWVRERRSMISKRLSKVQPPNKNTENNQYNSEAGINPGFFIMAICVANPAKI